MDKGLDLVWVSLIALVIVIIRTVYLELKPNYINSSLGSIKFRTASKSTFYFSGPSLRYTFNTKDVLEMIIHIDNRRLQGRGLYDKLRTYTYDGDFRFDVVMSKDFLTIGCTQISKKEYKKISQYLSINS